MTGKMGPREEGKEEMGRRGSRRSDILGGDEGQKKLTEAEAPWILDRVLAPALLLPPV